MANVLEYQVTFKYNSSDPQTVEKFYTPEAARKFMGSVELWGGVAVMTEELVDEDDISAGGVMEEKHNGNH